MQVPRSFTAPTSVPCGLDQRRVQLPPLRVGTVAQASGPRVWRLLDDAIAKGCNVIVLPEWTFAPERDHAAFKRDVDRLRALSTGRLIIAGTMSLIDRRDRQRNVAIAIADGRVLLTYAKRNDGGDTRRAAARGATWACGERPGLFTWRGIRVGIEICADHRERALRSDLQRDNGAPLGIQIVTSDGIDPMPEAFAIADGGVVIHTDMRTFSAQNGAYQRRGNELWRVRYDYHGDLRVSDVS